MIKIDARVTEDRFGPAPADRAEPTPWSGELLTLIKQLRDELNDFLVDVERGRELSGNRDPSRRR